MIAPNAREWSIRRREAMLFADAILPIIAREVAAALSAATPGIEARVREEMKREAEPRKQFPILGSQGAKIDWQLVADHCKQARANHYQTVERLAERGGLAWSELYAVLHDRPWQKIDENDAIRACRALETAYLVAAIRKG